MMKIFLVGFMGVGKSYWGKLWAQQLGMDFYDLDETIEQQEQKSISDIFEKNGEDEFRQIETEVLTSFDSKDNFIMACGGGTACFNRNMDWMNKHGLTIYLSANAKEIYKRVYNEKQKRPLLKNASNNELLEVIKIKLQEREHYYIQAKNTLAVNLLKVDSLQPILVQQY